MDPTSETNGNTSPSETSPLLANDAVSSSRDPEQSQDDTAAPEEGPSLKHLIPIVITLWFGAFFAALDTTIVATLAGPISSSFDSFTLYSWVATSYLIANAAFQPLSGKLTDIFSRRNGLVFANLSFAAGNLICGLATKPWVIILGRVISGFGGGGLQTVTVFTIGDLIPLRRRGLWLGLGNIVFGLGMGLGGLFGGLMNDTIGWRWAFLVQVPFFVVIGIADFFIINIPVKDTGKGRWKRIDFLGSILLVTAVVLLLIGVNTGGNQLPWTHPLVLTAIPLSVVVLGVYVYVEAYVVPEPIIPVRLLALRTVFFSCFNNWFAAMVAFAALYWLPLFAQAKGASSTLAGLRQIPFAIGTSIGSIVSGYIMRLTGRYWILVVCINATMLLSGVLFTTLDFSTPDWQAYIYLAFTGIGYGGTLVVTVVAMIAAVDQEHQATITAASYAFRSTGSSIGITIASAVFQNILSKQLWDRFAEKKHASEIIQRIRQDFGIINEQNKLPPSWREGVVESYMIAFRGVFVTILGLAALAALCSLLMREHKLHSTMSRK